MMTYRSEGVTLVELLVVLILLGVLGGMGVMGLLALRPAPGQALRDSLRQARASAIRDGEPVVLIWDSLTIRFLPDGRALGDSVDQLTGAWRDVR